LPTEAKLTPHAAERVAREAAMHPLEQAARSINIDWGTHYDAKQIERWSRRLGERLERLREAERQACERGERPAGPANDPQLLVIGVDGGRVQNREKNSENGSRWREDKVLTVTSMIPGDGLDKKPQPLVTTYLATMSDSHDFGALARVEAERRGIRQARQTIFIGDGANWIDPLRDQHFFRHPRIIDYYHAAEHLHEVAKAVHGDDADACAQLGEQLKDHLWHGRREPLLAQLRTFTQDAGPPRNGDGADHPRKVLDANLGYFTRHRQHMDYPAYRARGWPIGSGVTEAGVKQFNKRVKGTDQFWTDRGVQAILALRAHWLSQDDRWHHHWLCPRPKKEAA